MLEWNQGCSPPWDAADLERKIRDARNATEVGDGYLRDADRRRDRAAAAISPNAIPTAQSESDEEDEQSGDPGLIADLADIIKKEHRFAQNEGGRVFHYVGGVYSQRGEESIRRMVKRLCQVLKETEEWTPGFANAVVEYIRVDSPLLWERPPIAVINVKNGLLRISDRVLLPHDPDHLSAIQLPITYNPATMCPAIDKFISEVFPSDAVALGYEIPAFLMRPDTAIQKALLTLGPGGNGKSVYLGMVEAFLGKQNTSNLSLHKLESDKFAASRLYGKLANICPDLPTEHLAGTSVFKAITGGDPITGEYKFKDSFDFFPFSRLLFSANSPPLSKDSSQGFFDRWVVIPFTRSFRGTKAEVSRRELDARLSAPAELSGLLNKALEVLPELERRNGFTPAASTRTAWEEFHSTTDPLAVWLDQYTIDSPNAFIPKRQLRIAFNAALERQGRPAVTDTAFGLQFAKLRPQVSAKQRTYAASLQWCYIGIGMVDASHPSQGSQGLAPMFLSNNTPHTLHTHTPSHSRKEGGNDGENEGVEAAQEQDRGNPVNPVRYVNGCKHPAHHDLSKAGEGERIYWCPECQATVAEKEAT